MAAPLACGSGDRPDQRRDIALGRDRPQPISETRRSPNIQRNIVITLNDEQSNPVVRWKLINARPMKWTGSALAGKVGREVAIEELVVSAEGFEVEVA